MPSLSTNAANSQSTPQFPGGPQETLVSNYVRVREFSEFIAAPLTPEDCVVQSMPDVSPIRWHLAHTTWFFETFLLKNQPSYRIYHEGFESLFNSYYNSVGQPFSRDRRGQISRPGLEEVRRYRRHVDEAVVQSIEQDRLSPCEQDVLRLGLQHEQQHQELMFTDIKHVFFANPLRPAYDDGTKTESACQVDGLVPPSLLPRMMQWQRRGKGLVEVGHSGPSEFAYDNETPRHRTYIQPHALGSRCVTNGEYLDFIKDHGYARPELWLSLGWVQVMEHRWEAPMYWIRDGDSWWLFSMAGVIPLDLNEPVCHISYFEADAFARWAGSRLPTEFEWEVAANGIARNGVFADDLLREHKPIHPQIETAGEGNDLKLFGNVWEWTSSHYSPYPGYRPAPGALGEYNGKFMCNQFVLRGGSCASSSDHIRATYRNFFPPETRWQFSGIRLAKD